MQNKSKKIEKNKLLDTKQAQDFLDIADCIIKQSKIVGATDVEVSGNLCSGFSVNVYKNKVETIECSNEKHIAVKVYFNKNAGTASTTDFKNHAIKRMIEKACYIARFTENDPYLGLANKKLLASNSPELDLYHPWPITIAETIEIAKQCEAKGFSYDKRITNSEGVFVDTSSEIKIYANTNDFYGTILSTIHSINCSFIAEHHNEMQRDYYYSISRVPDKLEDYNSIATKAAQRTTARLKSKKITSQKCPVIFIAEITPNLINPFIKAISGYNLYRKESYLLNSLQKQVFANHISIEENPHIPQAIGSKPYDSEGVSLPRNYIIKNGFLERYVLDSYSGRKLKMQTTGNAGGVHNIRLTPGKLDFINLLRKMNTGLLITECIGCNTNIITGDFSCGIFGYWVNNGHIQYPVSCSTVAGNLKEMFLGIQEIGNDVDYRSNIFSGSILFDTMTISGR